jgi:hypothetical protein
VPLVTAGLVGAGVWFLVDQPFSRADAAAHAQTSRPRTPVAHAEGPACRPGPPQRVVYPALGVNAAVERIGLDVDGSGAGVRRLGNPTDITRIGWYTDGPHPGSGTGTVLLDGHTYRDGSAVFGEDFPTRARAGQVVQTVQRDGSVCSYRVQRVWPAVDAHRDYPRIVASEHLYDQDGPERLFLATCGGRWDAAREDYDDISILVATPLHP